MAAAKCFFAIQDLVDTLAPLLHVQDISRLMQTSRNMQEHWQPLLYRTINMTYYSRGKRLLRSADSKLALGRNVRHVRLLKLGLAEMVYLFNSMVAFIDIASPDAGSEIRPAWLPLPDRATFHVVPLPCMAQLKQLEVFFDRSKDNTMCPYRMPSINNSRANLAQVCWIAARSPNLVDLNLKSIAIKDERGLRLLMTTLTGLSRLRTFRLSLVAKASQWRHWGSAIFFSCPTAIQKIQIDMQDIAADQYLASADSIHERDRTDRNHGFNGGIDEDDSEVESPTLRTERLINLKELALWEMDKSTTAQDIVALFIHCPSIETLTLSNIRGSYDTEIVAQFVGELCPRLRQISCREWRGEGQTKQLPFRIMSAIPEHGLQEINCHSSSFILNDAVARKSFARHSITLETVVFDTCVGVNSQSLAVILAECPNLVVLQVTWSHIYKGPALHLEDAISAPWGSNKFRRLSLTIGIPVIHPTDASERPYYMQKGPVVLTEAETERFALLEKFYKQIGSLHELEFLDLRVDMVNALGEVFDDTTYEQLSFPGLLSLGNKRTGRVGYLDLLSGLNKLKELRGSVYARTDETEKTMGLREIVWIDQFWPRLELAEFLFENEPVSEPFQWLQVRTILQECRSLEGLLIWNVDSPRDFSISLKDAVAAIPWACIGIKDLRLVVKIHELYRTMGENEEYEDNELRPYYERPAPVFLTDFEKEQFSLLERLFRQIGALVDLEVLALRSNVIPEGHEENDGMWGMDTYLRESFPALLSLGDQETGRPGENSAIMGWSEARWLAEHLPSLEQAEFYSVSTPFRVPAQIAPHMQWLTEQRPTLKIWRSFLHVFALRH
ncbi:hypothetical protein BGZ89_012154 [Linnemannia elongata]|nr:hypothetical protein BGZ89_012154 [Linnemannia elongata]